MSSQQTVLLAAVIIVILAVCNSQLTFSPGWGKRSSEMYDPRVGNCRNANQMLMDIFKYVQSVAQSYMDCHQTK